MQTPETCPQTWDEKRLQKALDYVPPVQYGCSDRAHGGMQVTAGDVWDVLNDMVRHREVFTEAIARLTAELASVTKERDAILSQAQKDNLRAEDADRYEQWLLDLGRISGCGHVDENLPRCIEQAFEQKTDLIYEAKEVARKALDFCQIVCPPSPGEHGTYDADTGHMFKQLLEKERKNHADICASNKKCNDDMEQAMNDANRRANAAQVLVSNQRVEVAHAIARAESAEAERGFLQQYRDKMEEAHGSKLYAIEKLLDHFTEDGELKGDGKWRIREIWQCCKDFDEGSERAAKLFNGEASTERDELRAKLVAIKAALTKPMGYDHTGKLALIRSILHPTP